MTLKTIVKVGSITNLSDARYCAGMGVDMLGFCFSKQSGNFVELEKFEEIISWISGVDVVAEFDNETIEQINYLLSKHNFDWILTSNLACAQYYKSEEKKIIFNLNVHSEEDLLLLEKELLVYSAFDFVQINCENENLIPQIENNLKGWSEQINILKSFNIGSGTIDKQIKDMRFKGISLEGSLEEKPGMKDYDHIADILEVLEVEE